jgi:hypothetical protein
MLGRHGIRALLTMAVVVAVVYAGFGYLQVTGLPFAVKLLDARTAVVEPLPGVSLPDNIRAGDQIDLTALSLSGRIAIRLGSVGLRLPVGHTYTLAVRRGQTMVNVSVASTSANWNTKNWRFKARRLVILLALLFEGVVGLLALWRGRDRVAAGLALWMIADLIAAAVHAVPADGLTALGLGLASWTMILLARVGFYVMAESAAAAALSPRSRLWWRAAFLALLGLATIQGLGGYAAFVTTGWAGLLQGQNGLALTGAYLPPVALLFVSYRHAEPAQRPRQRWMLGGGALWMAGIAVTNLAPERSGHLDAIFLAAGLGAFLYATLRHRVVDFKVVLNRALVYAATTSLVLGLFALFESLIERMALGKEAGLLLELGVPLLLGASLSTVHKRIDGLIDRLVFRRQYQEDLALREFGKECAFVTQPDKLLDLAVDQVSRYAEAPWVAMYEQGPDGYVRVRQRGDQSLPTTLGIDDLALVKLRTHGADLNLHRLESRLSSDGYAFPLRMRGKLIGILVLGSRPGDRYSSEERELLAHVAHQVGAALFALRAEATELRAEASESSLREAREASEWRLREAREREQALLEALRSLGAHPSA